MTHAYVFFVLSAFCMLAATHPFVTYPLSLSLIRRHHYIPSMPSPAAPLETYAICVCAYNEENVIGTKAENLLVLKHALLGLHILVYVDGATDKTAETLENYSSDMDIYVASERNGKTHGMNFLVAQTTASVIIFSDANVLFNVESFVNLPRYFADPHVGCVCGHLKYTGTDASATAANGSLYWRFEERIKQLESETGSAMGADGSLFAIRRRLHHPPPDDVIDDMYVSLSILCDGHRIVCAPEILAYEQSIGSASEEFKRKIRIACQAFNVHRVLWPRLRGLARLDLYKYVSHKLLRWLCVYSLLLAVLFFDGALVAVGVGIPAIVLTALGFGLFMIARRRVSAVGKIEDILGAFVATGLGVFLSLLGKRFQTWSPAMSIRQKKRIGAWWN